MRTRDYINTGARAAMDFVGVTDKQRGDAYAYIDDLLKIRNLNRRSTAAWTRGNNSGDSATYERESAKSDKCFDRSKTIAKRRGWTISAPGLWWIVRDGNGNDITIRED